MHRVKIVVLSLTGLAVLAAAAGSVAASPAKTAWRIALTTNREGDSEIYSMKADGSAVRRLTRSPKFDGPGPWSRDGRRMLFYSQRSNGGIGRRSSPARRPTRFPPAPPAPVAAAPSSKRGSKRGS